MNVRCASCIVLVLAACEKTEVNYVEATPVIEVTATDAASLTTGPEN